jgi:WD40 repeat protein
VLGEPKVLRAHTGTVRRLHFSPEWSVLLSASDDGSVIVWDVARGTATFSAAVDVGGPATGVAVCRETGEIAAITGRLVLFIANFEKL